MTMATNAMRNFTISSLKNCCQGRRQKACQAQILKYDHIRSSELFSLPIVRIIIPQFKKRAPRHCQKWPTIARGARKTASHRIFLSHRKFLGEHVEHAVHMLLPVNDFSGWINDAGMTCVALRDLKRSMSLRWQSMTRSADCLG